MRGPRAVAETRVREALARALADGGRSRVLLGATDDGTSVHELWLDVHDSGTCRMLMRRARGPGPDSGPQRRTFMMAWNARRHDGLTADPLGAFGKYLPRKHAAPFARIVQALAGAADERVKKGVKLGAARPITPRTWRCLASAGSRRRG
jgi:hypothetical protein